MNVVDVLTQARDLIADPEHWTTGVLARNINGEDVDAGCDPCAVCWCAVGAIERIAEHTLFGPGYQGRLVLNSVARDTFGQSAAAVNDTRGHDAVMAMYDAAIERARAAE